MSRRDIILRALPWDGYHDAEWHAAYRQAACELDAEFPDPPIAPFMVGGVWWGDRTGTADCHAP